MTAASHPTTDEFLGVFRGDVTMDELVARVPPGALPGVTDALYDEIDTRIAGIDDRAVTFVPDDPESDEPDGKGWTLGHVIAHVTAGVEEGAALGSALARGAGITGRSRSEVPWESITTAAQVRDRLAESRRMALAFIRTWPDAPDLDMTDQPIPRFPPMNATGRHLLGLIHGHGHLAQIASIAGQAERAR